MEVGRTFSEVSTTKRSLFQPEAPPGTFFRIIRVQGTVISAKNLPNMDSWSKSDPFCVVKGVRTNNNLSDIHVTRAINNTLVPFWNEDFAFDCPVEWGQEGLEAIRFFVYDSDARYVTFIGSDDFLGGCEVDLTDFTHGQTVEHEFDLEGGPRRKERIFRLKKPRLTPRITVKLAIFRKETPLPEDHKDQLLRSLTHYKQVQNIDCHLFRAKNIAGNDSGNRSDHQCVVRALLISGKIREIFRAPMISNLQGWHERFQTKFYPEEEPMLLIIDVFDGSGDPSEDFTVTGKHLGSAWVSLFEFDSTGKRKKLHLHGESQLLETLLTKEGIPIRNALMADDTLLGHPSSSSRSLPNFAKLKRKPAKDSSRSTFYIECTLDTSNTAMPHASVLQQPAPIREAHDVLQVLPQFDYSRFPVPEEVQQLALGERTKPGCMKGRDCVVWVSGTIHGASALSMKEAGGGKKGNPYCIVEAMEEENDDRIFVHRTRAQKDTHYPVWRESFFLAVPEHIHVHALVFSVYDDANKGGDGIDDDDLYGSVLVDLDEILNGYKLQEDLPMTNTKVKHKPKNFAITTTVSTNSYYVAFRRYPYLSLEVRCERRVEPYFETYASLVTGLVAWERHQVSRQPIPKPPGSPDYEDAGQEELPLRSGAARQVFNLHVTKQLADLSNKPILNPRSWLDQPKRPIHSASSSRTRPRNSTVTWFDQPERLSNERPSQSASSSRAITPMPTNPDLFHAPPAVSEQQLQPIRPEVAHAEVCDFSEFRASTPQLVRPTSLPVLSTNFGRPGSRPGTADKVWLEALQFRADLEEAAGLLTQGMRLKPAAQALAVPNNSSSSRQSTPTLFRGDKGASAPTQAWHSHGK